MQGEKKKYQSNLSYQKTKKLVREYFQRGLANEVGLNRKMACTTRNL